MGTERSNNAAGTELLQGSLRLMIAHDEAYLLYGDINELNPVLPSWTPVLGLNPVAAHRLAPPIATTFSCGLIIRSTCPASASKALAFSSKYSCRSYTPRTPPMTWPRHRSA